MHSKPCLLCSYSLLMFRCTAYLSNPDGVRKRWTSLAVSHIVGEDGHSHVLTFCCGRNCRPRCSSWYKAVPLCGNGDTDKLKLFLLLLQCNGFLQIQFWIFFFFLRGCARTSPLDCWTSKMDTLTHQCFQN